MSGADDELRGLFAQEAAGQLDRMADAALAFERGEATPELIAAVFRDAHTLKSSSSLVGYPAVGDLAHALEDVLGDVRAGRRPVTQEVADALLAAADAVRAMLPAIDAGEDPTPIAAPALAAIARAAVPGTAAPSPSPSPAAVPGTAAPAEVVPVAFDRLDRLVRLSGEAVAAQLRLTHLLAAAIAEDDEAQAAAVALQRALGALQDQTLRTRMTSLDTIAAPLRRAVRDVARQTGKDVDYRLEGERVELDRAVLDGLREPLLHLVRNAVDHGIEDISERVPAGKPAVGTVVVTAARRGPEIRLEVRDDGAGLDLAALRRRAGAPDDLPDDRAAQLIFAAGLSTKDEVTGVSGRGVGMDAVRTAVEALRGRVEVDSVPGRGTTIALTVPLTLAVLPCLLVEAAGERYAIPSHAATTIVDDPREAEVGLEGRTALWVGGDIVTLSALPDVLGSDGSPGDGPAVVLDVGTATRHAFRVSAVAGQRDVTLQELGGVLPRNDLVAGASIEPDGSVVLVLDPVSLVDRATGATGRRGPAGGVVAAAPASDPAAGADVLVVDDAMTVRELQRSILERAGYTVRVATDGQDALTKLRARRPDCVITDVEMPELDGFALTQAIRADPRLSSVPVLMVTSRAAEADRRRGLEAGADAYLVKQDFDEPGLLGAVRRLLGEGP